jgi:hypothetical protein
MSMFICLCRFVPLPGHDLKRLLAESKAKGAWSIHMQRLDFGTSGHVAKPEGGVRENYIMRQETSERVRGISQTKRIRSAICEHYYQVNINLRQRDLLYC